MWVPFLSFSRCIAHAFILGHDSFSDSEEYSEAVLATFVTGTIALVLGMYLHVVVPSVSEHAGVAAHPLFFLSVCCPRVNRQGTRRKSGAAATSSKGAEDPSVVEERRRVASHPDFRQFPVVINGLVKEFPAKHRDAKVCASLRGSDDVYRAVNDLSLSVAQGETLGLLGSNGVWLSGCLAVWLSGCLAVWLCALLGCVFTRFLTFSSPCIPRTQVLAKLPP